MRKNHNRKRRIITGAAIVAALTIAGVAVFTVANTHAPANRYAGAAHAAEMDSAQLAELEPITWQTVDERFSGHTPTPADLQRCAITGEGAPVWFEENTDAEPVGKLTAELFTGEQQAVPCELTGDGTAWVMLPARGAASQSWGVLGITQNVTVEPMPALIRVDSASGTLTVTVDGEEVVSTPATVGADDTPTPAGLGFVQARFVDPEEPFTTGEAIGEPAGSVAISLLGSFSDPDPEQPARQHTAIHAFNDEPTIGCVGVSDIDALNTITSLPTGSLVVIE